MRIPSFAAKSLMTLSFAGCGGVFYQPDSYEYRRLDPMHAPMEDVTFPSRDGTRLHAWLLNAPGGGSAKGTVIHFHGNAQNLTGHVSFVDWLPACGFNVFSFDYRGYGTSEGSPTRSGIHQDGLAALDYVRGRNDVDRDKLLIFGQSLGGACALAAVGEGDQSGIRGVAVESTFYSYQSVANEKLGGTFFTYPLVWLLISNRHSPKASVAKISPIPLLVIHGDADEVVSIGQGRALFDAAEDPKQFWEVPGGGHTPAMERDEYRSKLVSYFEECLNPRK